MKDLLRYSSIFSTFNRLIGAVRARHEILKCYVRPQTGMRVLDIGCGMGEFAGVMPDVQFSGIDISPEYIGTARARYPEATFYLGNVLQTDLPEQAFDLIMMVGVLHHLSDEEVKALAVKMVDWLKQNGRVMLCEPCFVEGQHPFARWMLQNDRGEYVRNQAEYEVLLKPLFPQLKAEIRHDLLRIPYTHIFFEASLGASTEEMAA